MTWESIEDVAAEFGMGDPADLEVKLRQRVRALHPDRTGGTFSTEEQEEHFQRALKALKYVESRFPVPTEALTTISKRLQSLSEAIARIEQKRAFEAPNRQQLRETMRREAAAPYRPARLSGAAFSAAAGAILSFSQILNGNAVFGWIADSAVAIAGLVTLFVVFGALWVVTWLKSNRVKDRTEWLLSEDGLCYLVRGALDEHSSNLVITRRALARRVPYCGCPWSQNKWIRWMKKKMFADVPLPVAEQIAGIHLDELTKRGVLRQDGFRGIEPAFRIDPERAEEVLAESICYPGP